MSAVHTVIAAFAPAPESAVAKGDGSPPHEFGSQRGLDAWETLANLRTLLIGLRIALGMLAVVLVLLLEPELANGAWALLIAMAFAGYATLLCVVRRFGANLVDTPPWLWIDAAWCLALYAETGGAQALLLLLLFPPLFAAIRVGRRHSLLLTAVCAACVTITLARQTPALSLSHVLIALSVVLFAAPLSAMIGRRLLQSKQHFAFTSLLVQQLCPRAGLAPTAGAALKALSEHFHADVALLAIQPMHGDARVFMSERRRSTDELSSAAALNISRTLFGLSPEECVITAKASHLPWLCGRTVTRLGLQDASRQRLSQVPIAIEAVTSLLEQSNVLIVPAGNQAAVRLSLVLARNRSRYGAAKARAVHDVLTRLAPLLDNALLVERLTGSAADVELARIGRDLHDSAIQPYIGLKLAIEALQRRVPTASPFRNDVERLLDLTNEELQSIREVVNGLRTPPEGDRSLACAIARQARRFSTLFGIAVEVEVDKNLAAGRHVIGEILHLVAEGLSNVRRHTSARRAAVTLVDRNHELLLEIHNDRPFGEDPVRPFEPLSLSERARALGGTLAVTSDPGGTTLQITIPHAKTFRP